MLSVSMAKIWRTLVFFLWLQQFVTAIELDPNDKNSVISAVNTVTDNAFAFYVGNQPGQTPGLLVPPYYWWECGGFMGLLIQRWALTGNDSYNDLITQAMLHQVGDNKDFTPQNQTVDLGNDDQAFWAFAAMDAAELTFPNPPDDQPQWLALAQAVFNDQVSVWDQATCNGGIRWQIFSWNIGYDYKSLSSNGGFFQLAARLARYTGNQTYADYADKMWNWMQSSTIMSIDNATEIIDVWDGIHVENCSEPEKALFTYNPAILINGAAYMYNYTNGSDVWHARLTGLMNGMSRYFVQSLNGSGSPGEVPPANGSILAEITTEFEGTADPDQPSFKAWSMRWLAVATQLAPFTAAYIMPRIFASAVGAAAQCTGQAANQQTGTVCGQRWFSSAWDGSYGAGEQFSAMSVFQSLLIQSAKPPVTMMTGGTSQGNATGGGWGGGRQQGQNPWSANPWHDPALSKVMGPGDTAGASILTVLALTLAVGGLGWMARSDTFVEPTPNEKR